MTARIQPRGGLLRGLINKHTEIFEKWPLEVSANRTSESRVTYFLVLNRIIRKPEKMHVVFFNVL